MKNNLAINNICDAILNYSDKHDLIINHPNLIKVQQDFLYF